MWEKLVLKSSTLKNFCEFSFYVPLRVGFVALIVPVKQLLHL